MKKITSFAALCTVLFLAIILVGWQQQREFNFRFNEAEVGVLIKGLGKLPYEESASLIDKLIKQANDTTLQKTRR